MGSSDTLTTDYSSKEDVGEARVLLEVDVKALQRLLRYKSISVCEFRGGNNAGKQCVKSLYLDLLLETKNWQLATSPVK